MAKVYIGSKLPFAIELAVGSKVVLLQGTNANVISGVHASVPQGAFHVTEMDKDHWDEWRKTHASFAPLVRGQIWEDTSKRKAESAGEKKEGELNGTEPLNPENKKDKRLPKSKPKKDADSTGNLEGTLEKAE